jgi:hypothetical protein
MDEALVHLNDDGVSFVLSISSQSFSYSDYIATFTAAARLTQLDCNFLIVDRDKGALGADDLTGGGGGPNILMLGRGEIIPVLQGHFSVEMAVTVMFSAMAPPIQFIKTESEWQSFLDNTAIGVIAVFHNITNESFRQLRKMHVVHFSELRLAFADPQIFGGSEGIYVWRFADNNISKVVRELPEEYSEELQDILGRYVEPFIPRAEYRVLNNLEEEFRPFLILVFETADSFYLTPNQLKFAKDLNELSVMKVVYETTDLHALSSRKYGIPDELHNETAFVVVPGVNRTLKYRHPIDANYALEDLIKWCSDVRNGTATPFWKSAEPKENAPIVANNVMEWISEGWSILGIFYVDSDCLKAFVAAWKAFGDGVRFGTFDLMANDWPGEPLFLREFPRIVIFFDGKLVANIRAQETVDQIVAQINSYLVGGDVSDK